MQIKFNRVMVEDHDHALRFYTTVLGFQKMADLPMGGMRWLTVTSPDGLEGAELVLDPLVFPAANTYQKALFEAGIPAIAFITQDMDGEVRRLRDRGVKFRGEPKNLGPITAVLFEDTCGNLINLVQPTIQRR